MIQLNQMISARPFPPKPSPDARRAAAPGQPMPISPAESMWRMDVTNPARKMAFYFGLGVVFVRFSMIHEITSFLIHRNLYLLYLFAIPAFAGLFMTGGFRRIVGARPINYWLIFSVWLILAVPFSTWQGGSFDAVTQYWKTELSVLFIVAGLVLTWSECKAVIATMGLAAITDVIFSWIFGGDAGGRMALEFGEGSISNPNDLAGHLILLLPFLLAAAFVPGRAKVIRFAALGVAAYGYVVALSTGSRGALLALVVSAVFMLWRATPSQRFAVMALIPVVSVAALLALPPQIRDRLVNFSARAQSYEDEAGGSSAARTYLLKQSIRFSFERPIFGVGPGNFAEYEGNQSKREGRRGSWHEAHNSYTQVSAEAGLPALFLYLAAIISAYRMLVRTNTAARRAGRQGEEIAVVTFWMLVAFAGFFTAIMFLNFHAKFYIPSLIALVVAVSRAAARELQVAPGPAVANTLGHMANPVGHNMRPVRQNGLVGFQRQS
jgi:O-antigen ligase